MNGKGFSDLPEYYVSSHHSGPVPAYYAPSLPPHTAPTPPLKPPRPLSLPQRPVMPSSSRDSHLSVDSPQSSRLTLRTLSSGRTSITANDRHQNHINIGIDFGTTYSGVSWTIAGAQDTGVHTVDNWPNGHHVKVPTEIAYGDDGTISYGYAIAPDAERLGWFKLLLAENDLPQDVRESHQLKTARKLLDRLGKDAVEVTADYLRLIWQYAIAEIRHQNPRSIDGMPFRIVIGVPANWPAGAQVKMRMAAQRAGLLDTRAGGLVTDLEFVAEPEAAAVAAFHEGNIRHDICQGDIVIICDAGGGTVDIVTYEVTRTEPSITLSESIGNDMGLCGAIFLDEKFVSYMERKVGKDKFAKLPRSAHNQLMDIWEDKIKRQYSHGRPEIRTPIPHSVAKAVNPSYKKVLRMGAGSKQIAGDVMCFPSDDIEKMFDPIMRDIIELACKQRNEIMKKKQKKPKAIFLVGGLGGNQVLHERLEKGFSPSRDIQIIQPRGPNVWASISRGAAIKSMSYDDFNHDQPFPMVTSYISKAHYGMTFKEIFDDSKHGPEDRREYDAANDVYLAWDQMHWYVKKGDDVSKGDPVEMSWKFEQPENARGNCSITIYECETDEAPPRKTDQVRECAIITFNGRESTDFREGVDGQRIRIIQFDVRMTLLGLKGVEFATSINGRVAAQRHIKVKLGGDSQSTIAG